MMVHFLQPLLLLCAGFLTGCATPQMVILPFEAYHESVQKAHQCGPHTLSMILQYAGVIRSPQQIAEAIYDPKGLGTESLDLLLYAQSAGVEASLEKGTLKALHQSIDNGTPLLVALKEQGQQTHFVVVYGYLPKAVIVHNGYASNVTITNTEFLHQWETAGQMTLIVAQKTIEDRVE